jgi:lipid-binding SYLF domain-containing protein
MQKFAKKLKVIDISVVFGVVVCLSIAMQVTAMAESQARQQAVVDEAVEALKVFLSDPEMEWFKNNLKDAEGVMIVPSLIKAGFIIGGSGGRGVLLAHDKKTNQWSQPVFYTLGTGGIGLQIGAAKNMVLFFIRTKNGLDRFYSDSFKLGADISVAVGPVGAGTGATVIADIYTFTRSKGAFAGVSLDGSVVAINEEFNQNYYGQAVRPTDIIVKKKVSNPGSDKLRVNLAAAAQ